MVKVASWLDEVMSSGGDPAVAAKVREEIRKRKRNQGPALRH